MFPCRQPTGQPHLSVDDDLLAERVGGVISLPVITHLYVHPDTGHLEGGGDSPPGPSSPHGHCPGSTSSLSGDNGRWCMSGVDLPRLPYSQQSLLITMITACVASPPLPVSRPLPCYINRDIISRRHGRGPVSVDGICEDKTRGFPWSDTGRFRGAKLPALLISGRNYYQNECDREWSVALHGNCVAIWLYLFSNSDFSETASSPRTEIVRDRSAKLDNSYQCFGNK